MTLQKYPLTVVSFWTENFNSRVFGIGSTNNHTIWWKSRKWPWFQVNHHNNRSFHIFDGNKLLKTRSNLSDFATNIDFFAIQLLWLRMLRLRKSLPSKHQQFLQFSCQPRRNLKLQFILVPFWVIIFFLSFPLWPSLTLPSFLSAFSLSFPFSLSLRFAPFSTLSSLPPSQLFTPLFLLFFLPLIMFAIFLAQLLLFSLFMRLWHPW